MTREELINVFKYIVKKCDMLINNDDYEADDYTQDTVEDIADLCNHILDVDYGKLVEVKKVDLDYIQKELDEVVRIHKPPFGDFGWGTLYNVAMHFYELGLKAQKGV